MHDDENFETVDINSFFDSTPKEDDSEKIEMVTVKESECVGCGACADVCPNDAITVDDIAVIDASKCVDCGACIDECPSSALE